MTASRFQIVHSAREGIVNNTIDFSSGLYAVLLTELHTPSLTADNTLADLTNESVDGDYVRQDLTTVVVSEAGGVVTLDADDVSFGNPVTISAKYLYLIQGTTGASAGTDAVVCYVDLDGTSANPVSSTNGPFNVLISAQGIFELTQSLPPAVQAAGTVNINAVTDLNTVTSVTLTNSGAGYTAPPVVTFSASSTTLALGTAVMSGDIVASITIDNPGSYLDADLPITVTIAAP